ncbi:hypothetical protein [Pedobacter sp. GR22-6]|uniref:hypothetical protein n=1 Tax=Pedobacter sp. GR22-6 TaxID=3127957 RepID=UPI00307F385E
MQIDDPNHTLAVKIVTNLCDKLLIVDTTAKQIEMLLEQGKMTERFWIAAFDKKITASIPANET